MPEIILAAAQGSDFIAIYGMDVNFIVFQTSSEHISTLEKKIVGEMVFVKETCLLFFFCCKWKSPIVKTFISKTALKRSSNSEASFKSPS